MKFSLPAIDLSTQAPEQSGWPQRSVEAAPQWKRPLALAGAVHLTVLLLGLLSPLIFNRRPVLPEIYRVSLFSATEMTGPPAAKPKAPAPAKRPAPKPRMQQAEPAPAPQPVKTMKPEQLKKEVAPPPAAKPAPPAGKPALSESPIKTRTKSPEDLAALAALRRKLAAQRAKEAELVAERQVKEALSSIKRLYRQEAVQAAPAVQGTAAAAPPAATAAPAAREEAASAAGGSSNGQDATVLDKTRNRYLAAVHSRIQEHWALPDLQSWDSTLEAILVIQVRRDGIVSRSFFEKKADNLYFNQFVEKTIKEAAPLPPFPPDLQESQLEIGLVFRPGELL